MVRFADGSLAGRTVELFSRKHSPKSGWWLELRDPETHGVTQVREPDAGPYELVDPAEVVS